MRSRLLPTLLLLLVCAGALRLRLQDPYDLVFTQDQVVLRSNDPWYHMRLTDNLLHSFPQRLTFDPYALYPKGQDIGYAPLLDLLIAGPARASFGPSPPDYWVMFIAAILPPIFGVLVVCVVFAMGRALFDPWTGLLAAAIVAFAPGQFLLVSLVGFADHHVLEVLLSTCVILCWIRSRPVLAGVALGLYLLCWQGGVVFVAILLIWMTAQCVWNRESGPALLRLSLGTFPVALLVLLPFIAWGSVVWRPVAAVLAAGIACIAMCALLERSIVPAIVLPPLALAAMFSGLFQAAEQHVSLFEYFRTGPKVWEIRPLLFATGHFSISPALGEFGQATWLILPGLALIAWKCRDRKPEMSLFLATSVAWLVCTLAMRRFAYYFLVYAALLAASFCITLAKRAGKWAVVVGIAAFAGLVLSSLAPAFVTGQPDLARLSGAAAAGPDTDWREALTWMRTNTPEPLGSPDAYYQAFDTQTLRHTVPAYGVMVWGYEGFWVTRIAHRIPMDNPTWIGSNESASFYVGSDPAAAPGARYVIAPASVPLQAGPDGATAAGEFAVMANWIGRDRAQFAERFYFPDGRPKLLYFPAYFQSMAARLCVFEGRAVQPDLVGVVQFREERDRKIVTTYHEYQSYSDAVRASTPASRIVSPDPRRSCVSLAELDKYRLVHESPMHEVKIYERH